MSKRKIVTLGLTVILILSLFSTIPAYAANYVDEAKKYGISTEGLSDKEIKEKVKAHKKDFEQIEKTAKELNIDISGLSLEDAIAKVDTALEYLESNDYYSSKDELGSMMDAIAAVKTNNEKKLLKAVKNLESCLPGISSLSYEEARAMFIEALKYHANVDIEALSLGEAKDRVKEAIRAGAVEEAEFYGVDISGLPLEKALAKIDEAKIEMMKREFEELYEYANRNNVDITGLSKDEAWQKIKTLEANKCAADLGIDTTGLTLDEIWAKVEVRQNEELQKQANEFGIDITGLSKEEAWMRVKEKANLMKMQEIANRYGIDTTGLSENELKDLIQAKEREELERTAQEHNIDISGLTTEEAWNKVSKVVHTIKQAELEAEAAKYGVDITGLSMDEAWKKVKQTMMQQQAAKYEVDITGLSWDEAWAKIKEAAPKFPNPEEEARIRLEQLKNEAAKYNIDTTGLTEEQILEKLDEATVDIRYRLYLEDQARAFLFDPTGMTNEEIEIALDEAMKQSCIEDAKRVQLKEYTERAISYGIDPTGLTVQEITDKICEVIRYREMQSSLQNQAAELGIDISGLTNDEAQVKINQVRQEIIDREAAERNAREDAAREAERLAAKSN